MPKERTLVNGGGMRYVGERCSVIFDPCDAQIAHLLAMQDPSPSRCSCTAGVGRTAADS